MTEEEIQRGWDVFDVGGAWEIERDDELNKFADDEEAIQAACAEARDGDRYAIEAIIAVAFQGDSWPEFLAEHNGLKESAAG